MPTIQESKTHDLIQSACKKFIDSHKKIDWEQRRYELTKDILCALASNPKIDNVNYSDVEIVIGLADKVIESLRK